MTDETPVDRAAEAIRRLPGATYVNSARAARVAFESIDREALRAEFKRLGMGAGLHEELREKVLDEWADAMLAWLRGESDG